MMAVVQTRAPGGATEAKQNDLITRIDQLLVEADELLRAGQSVDVGNFPNTYPLPSAQMDALAPWSGGLTNEQLRDEDVDVADSGEREYTHIVATVTEAGNTVIHSPAAGKRVRVRYFYAINKPKVASTPLIKLLLGAEEKYRVWALAKRQKITGPVDGDVIINLSEAGTVAVTVLLEEVD